MFLHKKPVSQCLLVTLAVVFVSGASLAQCKGTPILRMSYEGFGMVLNGKHVYFLACASGEVEYDDGEFDGRGLPRRKCDLLTDKQREGLVALVNEKGTRHLTGKYSGALVVRDHHEWLNVTVFRPEGQQQFTAADFYGETAKTYPLELVSFLCGIDKLRIKTDWHVSDSLPCSSNLGGR
jgi:hypothetical protein